MKPLLVTIFVFIFNNQYAQTAKIKFNQADAESLSMSVDEVTPQKTPINKFYVKISDAKTGAIYSIQTPQLKLPKVVNLKADGSYELVDLSSVLLDARSIIIELLEDKNVLNAFIIPNALIDNGGDGKQEIVIPNTTAANFIFSQYPGLKSNGFGLQLPFKTSDQTKLNYTGENYVHLFFDQNGNNLFSTIPTGIPQINYVVHIIYLRIENEPNKISYSLSQTAGDFDDSYQLAGAGSLDKFSLTSSAGGKKEDVSEVKFEWSEEVTLLGKSTSDIKFDIYRNILVPPNDSANSLKIQKSKDNTIKMKKVYHASVSAGLLYTSLQNPTFELIESEHDSAQFYVKNLGAGPRGIISTNIVFYASPILAILNCIDNKKQHSMPDYKTWGRSYYDDHKFYERLYPTVGVGISDSLFVNFFAGFSFEFARGVALTGGYHFGKVNLYNHDSGFQFNNTLVTKEQFELNNDVAWRGNFAFGLTIDAIILTSLFQSAN